MEIVFLGTGSGIPSRERNHPAILLKYEGRQLLWDCGEGTQRQMAIAGESPMKIDDIFITHWHADHFAGLIGLIQSMNLEDRNKPLTIYGPEAELFVSDILELGHWGVGFPVKGKSLDFQGNDIETVARYEDFSVFSIPVAHTVPAVAYCFKENDRINVDLKKASVYGLKQGPVIGKLKEEGSVVHRGTKIKLEDVSTTRLGRKIVYSGDTTPCGNMIKISENADILIHDSTFLEDVVSEEKRRKSHSSVDEVAEIAKKAGVKKLILTHFSRRYHSLKDFETSAKKIFPDTITAKDFMRVKM
ncbi:MAG: ribonuclease Z [Candidatus Aenigmarchaeota archaeon]|nr:ribonuclease Z [Candidatus Aenigmarchaeota archaeon]